jgi:hypothetical protein
MYIYVCVCVCVYTGSLPCDICYMSFRSHNSGLSICPAGIHAWCVPGVISRHVGACHVSGLRVGHVGPLVLLYARVPLVAQCAAEGGKTNIYVSVVFWMFGSFKIPPTGPGSATVGFS